MLVWPGNGDWLVVPVLYNNAKTSRLQSCLNHWFHILLGYLASNSNQQLMLAITVRNAECVSSLMYEHCFPVTHHVECKGGTAGIAISTIEAEEAVASSLTVGFLSHKTISKWLPKLAVIAIELSPHYISLIP